MNNEQKEIFDAVEKINEELYTKYAKINKVDYLPTVTCSFGGNYSFISISIASEFNIPEINIYFSENDDRIYYEKSDKYETFYKYIKRKFKLLKEEIYSVKL
jgi:hypothetical protein